MRKYTSNYRVKKLIYKNNAFLLIILNGLSKIKRSERKVCL
jgi:hypothetical protein